VSLALTAHCHNKVLSTILICFKMNKTDKRKSTNLFSTNVRETVSARPLSLRVVRKCVSARHLSLRVVRKCVSARPWSLRVVRKCVSARPLSLRVVRKCEMQDHVPRILMQCRNQLGLQT
jgi:hypothetical protein